MTASDNLDSSDIESFRSQLHGMLLEPGDDGYEDARSIWNGMVDKHPRVIAKCEDASDVSAAVNFAREQELLLAVQGGGHNVAGKSVCDGGLLIDLSRMNNISVKPESKIAHVGPGATWSDLDQATQEHGLATTGGIDSGTGVAGLTLGGGIGHLARSFGLTCDNLRSVDLVTADGRLVSASEDEHSELFWGLRGGGGNFGVVTEFEFDLHEVGPQILTAQAFHPIEDARAGLEFYREFMDQAPDEVACYGLIVHIPPEEPFPPEYHGKGALAFVSTFSGPPEDGKAFLRPIIEFGDPIVAFAEEMPYTAIQSMFDDAQPAGERYYFKSHFIDTLSEAAIETILEHTDPLPGPYTGVFFEPMGGAINAVDATDTAYPHRDSSFSFGIAAGWSDPDRDEELIEWSREFHEAMGPHCTGGVYANYLDHDDDDMVAEAYQENYNRLAELKAKWDPENLFSLNQNISPAS